MKKVTYFLALAMAIGLSGNYSASAQGNGHKYGHDKNNNGNRDHGNRDRDDRGNGGNGNDRGNHGNGNDHDRGNNDGHWNRGDNGNHHSYGHGNNRHDYGRNDRRDHWDRRSVNHYYHTHDRYCGHNNVVVYNYSRPRYIYYRDYDVYYDCTRSVYISYSGRSWTMSTILPFGMRNIDLRRANRYEVDYWDDNLPVYLERRRPSCDRVYYGG